eukprot:365263-Chlamydomonas_euryale.AAC.11
MCTCAGAAAFISAKCDPGCTHQNASSMLNAPAMGFPDKAASACFSWHVCAGRRVAAGAPARSAMHELVQPAACVEHVRPDDAWRLVVPFGASLGSSRCRGTSAERPVHARQLQRAGQAGGGGGGAAGDVAAAGAAAGGGTCRYPKRAPSVRAPRRRAAERVEEPGSPGESMRKISSAVSTWSLQMAARVKPTSSVAARGAWPLPCACRHRLAFSRHDVLLLDAQQALTLRGDVTLTKCGFAAVAELGAICVLTLWLKVWPRRCVVKQLLHTSRASLARRHSSPSCPALSLQIPASRQCSDSVDEGVVKQDGRKEWLKGGWTTG